MEVAKHPRIYWANALFSEADRAFNKACAEFLRPLGYEVFLPQDASVNEEIAPTAETVFRVDTKAILESDVLVACLDHETVDCGVACEIGVAYSFGLPIVGLYTDVRQHRTGPGRMYKNLYVLGAIGVHGRIVANTGALPDAVKEMLASSGPMHAIDAIAVDHFSSVAFSYADFASRLEALYEPAWSADSLVDECIEDVRPLRVLEYGCGPGDQGARIRERYRNSTYLGYDASTAMIEMARSRFAALSGRYTSDFNDVMAEAHREKFDLVIALFSLHDRSDRERTIAALEQCISEGGHLLIIDLSTGDLPELTSRLRRLLASPAVTPDPRFEATWLASTARLLGLRVVSMTLHVPGIQFPSLSDLDEYFQVFGVYQGMDLPLGLQPTSREGIRTRLMAAMAQWSFPFRDQRAFVQCLMRK